MNRNRKSGLAFALLVLMQSIYFAGQAQQDTISLRMCYDSSMTNFPLSGQVRLIKQSYDLKLKNLTSQWLPQVSLNGQVNYNSDVTSIAIDLPIPGVEFPKSPHDQYKISLDINQTLWDGGYKRSAAKLEDITRQADISQIQVDLYGLRERINKVYFLALVLAGNESLMSLAVGTLEEKISTAGSAVRNGILTPVNLQILQAEKLKAEQKKFEIQSDRHAALEILTYLTGLQLFPEVVLETPEIGSFPSLSEISRPEMGLFDLQMQRLDLAKDVAAVKNKPRLFAFGQAGYGKPGLNMLNTEWDTYWVIGAGLKWTLWDWHITQREKQVLGLQKEMVGNQKESFSVNIAVQSASEFSAFNKYSEAVKRDLELLGLRNEILNTVSSQLDNGIITSSDYVQELNAKLQAEISLQTDRILMLQARQNLLTIYGK
ncbi:MAG: TolC family protein [Bacteroidales bacterium]